MQVFDEKGSQNTQRTIEIAIERALALHTSIVIATTQGGTAVAMAREVAGRVPLVVVGHAYGSREAGTNAMLPEHAAALQEFGVPVIHAAHALSGAERGISSRFNGAYPVEIIAHTLRMLSPGVKVGVEIAAMALDAGKIPLQPVVAVGGSAQGADTAILLTPAYTAKIFDTHIHEIYCKPF